MKMLICTLSITVLLLTLQSCNTQPTNQELAAAQARIRELEKEVQELKRQLNQPPSPVEKSGKERYIGQWRKLGGSGIMTISDNGTNLFIRDDHGQKFTGTVESNGDLQTSIMVKMSIVQQTGHLVWINGEYEKISGK